MFKREISGQICTLILISLGGLLLHIRIHPPAADADKWIPIIFGVFSVCILPFMFNYAKTAPLAYLINLLSVVGGVIAMAYFSAIHPPKPITPTTLLLQTTLADIIILLAKLPPAQDIIKYWKLSVKKSGNQ